MAWALQLSWLFYTCFVLVGIHCDGRNAGQPKNRSLSVEQPSMLSDDGHLIFKTGNNKEIRFQTSASGSVKVGEEDLTKLLSQIKINKEDIDDIRIHGGAIPPEVDNRLNDLQTKVSGLLTRVTALEVTVQQVSCTSDPCQNGGTCINTLNSFHCLCPNNWAGPICATDVNECQVLSGTSQGCQNGATCVNSPGSFTCSCSPEWSGALCTVRYDDCRTTGQDLCVHGLCIDADRVVTGQPSFKCICQTGWGTSAGNPACTADVDECNLPNKPCSTNPVVPCHNTEGSFYCGACPAGWQGNGYSCQDVNECTNNNGGCSITPLVQCLNTMGSFHCGSCPLGYEGDGRTCTPTNICATNNGGCHFLATCTSATGSNFPSCTCPAGYTGNGYGPTGCSQISNICQSNNPCVHGQCMDITSSPGYTCNCNIGWQGQNCDQNINECASNPCQNNGTCIDGTNGFTCNCTAQWTGPRCQTPQQECGGYLTGPAGSFSYPNTPGHEDYDHQVSCAWVIRVESDKIIRITFPFFHLENSANCNFDFLQIQDGNSASAHIIGKYCGQNNPLELYSSHNSLYFWFRSDHSVSAGGFKIVWESQVPVCGGQLTAPYGSINSPGYPGNYPPNRDCYWTLTVDPGTIITFAFGILSLEHHSDCNYDFLEVRDGLLSEDQVLGKYCSTIQPPPLSTTGPAAWIHFHSDSSVSDRGFHITYITSPSDPGCGGTYTSSEGIIISPNWPNDYAHNRQCIYLISLPVGEKVKLNFTHMNLETHTGCAFDFVEVRDGRTETDPLMGKYCGSILPAPIISSSNSLWIRFKSDGSVSRAGFRAVYGVACGGTLSGTGQFHSPYHPNAYPHNLACEWVITQPEGYVVTIDFLSFDIESGSCGYDFVQVRDGSTSSSPLLGTFCGNDIPPRLQSTQRYMYIKFKTDSSVKNRGFEAVYTSALEGCGDTLTSPSGIITSPGHPTSYPHGANCTWYISVSLGNLIQLNFDSFNLEHHDNCNYDYLEVYDNGTVETGTKIGRYCGRSVPPSITSTDNLLTLLFVSDSSLAKEGFSANYVSINASMDCGETLSSPMGSFRSPNYPNNYPNNRDCIFKIILEVNRQIMLNFSSFTLEGSPPTCRYDFVEIRDGGYKTSPLIGKFCGTQRPPVVVSHSNRLWIRFHSDRSSTRQGFIAHWDGSLTGCGGTLTTSSGGFSSPNFPLPYHPNSECYWNIKSSQGSQVLLSFSDFYLESSSSCSQDFLAVHDGNSTNAPQLAKLCGNQLPSTINSSRNELYIKLRTDSSVSTGGFLSSYTTNCHNILILNRHDGMVESLNFPNSYPENSMCSWTIQGSRGNTINYTFIAFQLESSSSCSYDYIKLYNGPNVEAPLIGTFCGNMPPSANSTTGSALTVVFRTDRTVSMSGFQMMWYQNGCGGDFFGPTGSFNSPGYPNKYPENRECIWYIRTSPGSSITLTINEFDVEFHPNCHYDVLEVYGGPDLQAPRLTQLCSTTSKPMQVSSTGNLMTVLFMSDAYVSGRGFSASWAEAPGGCGGPVTAPSGEIHSPSYPNSYPNNVDCTWVISVDAQHRVFFNFSDLDIESHSNCSWDYVAIYDGETAFSSLLAHVCGNSLPSYVTSTQNSITVRFRSDSSRSHRGFSAHFSEACGSSITTDDVGGFVASPRYPSQYPANQNCSWIIRAREPFNHVTLSFTDFELEMVSSNCSHDAVEVLDGDNYQAPSIGRFCGDEVPHPITSLSNSLVVNFVSDNSVSRKGFRATYSASTSSCGGDLVMETGAFNSPNFPDAYPPNVECVWTIKSSPGNRIQLSFITFHLQGDSGCHNDYLEIKEVNSTGPVIGRFCGTSLPSNYTSVIGHILWVKFVSDASVSGAGFRASFSHLYGNDLTGEYGQLASPLYPRTYPNNVDYHWTITVEGDHYIQIRFLDMDIEDHYDCHFDTLKIFDGSSVHNYILGTFCGLALPPPVQSSGSTVTLQFQSDSVVGGRGFLLEWLSLQDSGPPPTISPGACGGMLMTGDSPAFLFSPGWPDDYANDQDCTWLIRSPGATVELNILSLDIEDFPMCLYDNLVIRDGDTSLSPVLAKLCGRELPGSLHSTGDSMYIHFMSDSSISGRGFNASYSRGCGGLLHVDRGVLSSPNYPLNYLSSQNCSWHVMVTPGFRVSVTFHSPFQVQGYGTDCSLGDYIELRNGPGVSSPMLGPRLCGSSPPSPVQTTDNHLFVHFISDASNEGSGFKLIFEAHSQACGGKISLNDNDPPGYISSPNYPQNYPQNVDCIWIITAPNGEAVQIDFEDEFYIETTQGCSYDYLEVRDGSMLSANLISRLCGNTRPSTQHSTGSSILLRFRTDTSVTHKGFKAKFSIATCSGTFRGQSGTITSPGFPGSYYPASSNCEWYVEGPTGHYLTLSYGNFSLQLSPECLADYVEIREYNATGKLLGHHCGSELPAHMETSDSFAYIRFVSDAVQNAAGFSLSFEASVEVCGGELNAQSGTISSPNYPNLYPHSRVCYWKIRVSPDRRVIFTIDDLRLEDSGTSCAYDYVEVLNGLASNAPLLERFCGTVPTGTQVRSSGNTMTIIFRTDASVSNGGFRASYSSDEPAVCGGVLNNPVGENFTSPGYPLSNYSSNLNCEWLIQNRQDVNSSIVVLITDMHLESHQTCESDFLQFRLGNADGDLLAVFCGSTIPRIPIVVFTPDLWVHFQTDSSQGDVGFKAVYSFSECGGWQTGEGGVLSSPNYPDRYPSPSRCAWLLEASEGHTITLTFSYFHLEQHPTCKWDSVTIFNGGSPGSPIIGHYCGNTSPGRIQSGSNKLSVIFLADHSVSGGGFLASWSADSSGCGGVIHADTGIFKSPNYPQNFSANVECSWQIIAHEGNHLEMTFNRDFQIPDSSGSCQTSYIKVWAGESQNSEALLSTGCGSVAPAPIIAPFNVITAQFQATETTGKGFLVSFTTRCGANFTSTSGRVVSPNYPADYPDESNCNYIIDAGEQTVVLVTFQIFQVEAHSTCQYDGLKVYNVAEGGAPIAVLCGSNIPGPISTFGPMLLNFYSDSVISDTGFMAEYQVIPCGGFFNSTLGTVSSPGLSMTNYHHNINCTYHMQVAENRVVDLKFNTFHLEASSSCYFDFVAVYDGPDTLSPLLGKFCGAILPPNLRSSTNHLFIVFRTDHSVSGTGWRATYHETLGAAQGCGGYLSMPMGMFGSPDPNLDGRYEPLMDCTWTIEMTINRAINLTFDSFELESSSTCRYDYVKVYDGENVNYPLVGIFCGNTIPTFVSSSNFLTVHFVTDNSVQRRGFNATYRAVPLLCGGTLNATFSRQTLTSPFFPNAYPPYTTCQWILDAPPQETIQISFQNFTLQASQSCSTNFLEIKDWPTGDYGQSHKFCSADALPDFYSYRRTVLVYFKSDAYMTGNGLNFTYQTANCSRVYEQEYGYLKSPGWPGIYPHNIDCIFILKSPQNNIISFFFDSFDVESHNSCNYDYLEVRNGSTADSPLIGRYCGSTLPNPIFPQSNTLYLHFRSDWSNSRNGFEVTWTSSVHGCGGTLYGDHGSFSSPNYPGTYPNSTRCEWGIRAPRGRVVTVTFAQISIDDPGDCLNNFLKLYDGPDASSQPIGPYCGVETDIAPFTASSHLVFIVFQAQHPNLPSGFKLTWSS